MPSPAPLLDIAAARRLVQEYAGLDMHVTACWQRPRGMYRVSFDEDEDDANFYFAVVESFPRLLGATRHVAVNRRTGEITEIGSFGE